MDWNIPRAFIDSLVVGICDRVRHKRIAVCRPRRGRYLVRSSGIYDVWELSVLGQGSVCNRSAVGAKIPLLTGEFDACTAQTVIISVIEGCIILYIVILSTQCLETCLQPFEGSATV